MFKKLWVPYRTFRDNGDSKKLAGLQQGFTFRKGSLVDVWNDRSIERVDISNSVLVSYQPGDAFEAGLLVVKEEE